MDIFWSYTIMFSQDPNYNPVKFFGEQGWCSGESTRLPPMWPRFDSQSRCHMWVEFVVGSCPCSERFFSGYSGFPLSSKTNISKFQFDPEPETTDLSVSDCQVSPSLNKVDLFISFKPGLVESNTEKAMQSALSECTLLNMRILKSFL